MRLVLALVLALWAGAVFAQKVTITQDGNLTTVRISGALQPTQSPKCTSMVDAADDLSPPDLFLAVIDCLGMGRGESAARLVILMLARAEFDARRVADRTAHDAGKVLHEMLLGTLTPEKRMLLDTAMARLTDPTGKDFIEKLCITMVILPPPSHDPWYMIAYGREPPSGGFPALLVAEFDAKAAWKDVAKSWLKCPIP